MPSRRGRSSSRSPAQPWRNSHDPYRSSATAPEPPVSTTYPCYTAPSVQAMGYHITHCSTHQCPCLPRADIRTFTNAPYLAARICRNPVSHNGRMFDLVASLALQHGDAKYSDVTSKIWQLHWQSNDWLSCPINLLPRKDRAIFTCSPDVYDLRHAPANTLIVDFANKHVGGGCFSSGFVQEEQLVMQSLDLAARLAAHRPYLNWNDAVTFEGVHFDAWWPRDVAALKSDIPHHAVQPCTSRPTTVIAVNAPVAWRRYNAASLRMLACKIAPTPPTHTPVIDPRPLPDVHFRITHGIKPLFTVDTVLCLVAYA